MLLLSKHQLKSEDLGGVKFVGDQTKKIVDVVLDGTAAAGGISETLYAAHKNELRVLATSEPLPGALMVAHPKVGANVIKDLRALFVTYVPAPGSPRFAQGAVAVTDATYNRVRSARWFWGRCICRGRRPPHSARRVQPDLECGGNRLRFDIR